jgi:hypothetical protein
MDFAGREPAGHLGRQTAEELWTGGAIARLRSEHAERKFAGFRLCPGCRDWDSV